MCAHADRAPRSCACLAQTLAATSTRCASPPTSPCSSRARRATSARFSPSSARRPSASTARVRRSRSCSRSQRAARRASQPLAVGTVDRELTRHRSHRSQASPCPRRSPCARSAARRRRRTTASPGPSRTSSRASSLLGFLSRVHAHRAPRLIVVLLDRTQSAVRRRRRGRSARARRRREERRERRRDQEPAARGHRGARAAGDAQPRGCGEARL